MSSLAKIWWCGTHVFYPMKEGFHTMVLNNAAQGCKKWHNRHNSSIVKDVCTCIFWEVREGGRNEVLSFCPSFFFRLNWFRTWWKHDILWPRVELRGKGTRDDPHNDRILNHKWRKKKVLVAWHDHLTQKWPRWQVEVSGFGRSVSFRYHLCTSVYTWTSEQPNS